MYEEAELEEKLQEWARMNTKRNTPSGSGNSTFGQFVAGIRGTVAGHDVAADLAAVLGS